MRSSPTRRRRHGRRPGYLYEFEGWDPRELLKGKLHEVVIYDGQTRQNPVNRWRQHEHGSPNGEPPKIWWPLVTKKHVRKSWAFVSDFKLDMREGWLIARRRPIANISLNMTNPRRIKPWEMKQLMEQINRRGGVAALVRQARHKQWRSRWTRLLDWFRGEQEETPEVAPAGAGWRINQTSGDVTWYGRDAQEAGASWLR